MQMQVHADAQELGRAAAEMTVLACTAAIAARGVCHLGLAGGNTPRFCYEALRDMDVEWSRLHIWFGDERCLPSGDVGRNDRMADEALLRHVAIPQSRVHRMPAELGPEEGAKRYAVMLATAPAMDVLHLGMGEDGHTASLFPGNAALADARLAVPVFNSPKPPPERVSMGFSMLNAARQILILAAGVGKQDALARIRSGERLPVAMVQHPLWFIDRDAAG